MKKFIGDRDFYKRLLAIMIPILIQNVITNFVSLLDNIMVGRIGTEPMSGVAVINQLLFVFNQAVFGGLAGAGIYTAQYYGKGDDDGVKNTIRAKAWISFAILVVSMLLFGLFGKELAGLFIHEGNGGISTEDTLKYAMKYLRIMMLQMPLFALINVYSSSLRETSRTKIPMAAALAAVAVNLTGNYILIYGKFGAPRLGVEGAAIATVASRAVELTVCVAGAKYKGIWKTLKVPKELFEKLLVKGLPLAVNEILWSSGLTTLNQVLSVRGIEVVSAENISSTVSNLFFCAFFAMGATVSIMIGQHLGAGDFDRAIDEDRKLIAFASAISLVAGVIMIIISPYMPRIYKTTELVKHLATYMIMINAIMMPINAFNNSCFFTLRSGGRVWITALYDSLYFWIISIPITRALVYHTAMATITIYFISYIIDIVKSIFGFILVRSGIWINNLVKGD